MTPSCSWDDWEWHEPWRHNGRGRPEPPNHPQSSSMDHPLSSNPAIWFCARMWNCENSKTIEFHQSIWLNTLSAKKYRSSEKSFENEMILKHLPFPPWHLSFAIFHWRCCIDRNVFHLGCVVFAMHFNGMHLYRLSIWRRCIWWCISIGCNGDVFQGDALEDAIEGCTDCDHGTVADDL